MLTDMSITGGKVAIMALLMMAAGYLTALDARGVGQVIVWIWCNSEMLLTWGFGGVIG